MGQSINLNIHYSAPDSVWNSLKDIYASMPNWKGYHKGFPYWFGTSDDYYLTVSVEPSGLQLYGSIDENDFNEWVTAFRKVATERLGYPIGEPEDGYDFMYYND